MDIRIPPHLDEFASLAEWKHARALYFKNLTRRDRTPKTIERLVEVPVETIREVEVERIVYVDREVSVDRFVEIYSDPEIIEIPRFLAPDPIVEFIEAERYDHESFEAARARLWLRLEILLNRAKDGPLSDMDEADKRTLTSGLKGVI